MIYFLWDLMSIEFVIVTIIALIFGIWVGFYAGKPRSLKGKHVLVIYFVLPSYITIFQFHVYLFVYKR